MELISGSILSMLVGGILRFVPAVLKFLDAKNERAHELAMQDKMIETEKVRSQNRLNEIGAEYQGRVDEKTVQAWIEALRGQAKATGIKWVDAVNALVRPVVTYWLFGLYAAYKTALIVLAAQDQGAVIALGSTWTAQDMELLSGILGFWFVNRSLLKKNA